MSQKASIKARIIRAGLYIGFLFFLQEIVVRICYPLPEVANLDRMIYEDPNNPDVTFLRNLTRTWQSQIDTPFVFEHKMNHYGFRGEEWVIEKPPQKQRMLFIGDSFVEGVMASDEKTIPNGFLHEVGLGGYEVMNAGMVGRGLSTYLQATADLVPLYKPDIVFICIYANDLGQKEPVIPQGSLEPESFSWYIPRFVELIRERGKHGSVRPIWSGDSRTYFPTVPQPSNPLTKNAETIRPLVSPKLFEDMKEGRFNPFRTNSLYKEDLYLKQVPQLGSAIPFIQSTCEKAGTKAVVVYFPSRHQVTRHYIQYDLELCRMDCPDTLDLTTPAFQLHQRVLAEQCKASKIEFLDMTDYIRERESQGEHLYWNYDEHMRGDAYMELGAAMAQRSNTVNDMKTQ